MKAKQLKNGTWSISGITTETIEDIHKMILFGKMVDNSYCHNVEEIRKKIDELRKDEDFNQNIGLVEFFFRCLTNK